MTPDARAARTASGVANGASSSTQSESPPAGVRERQAARRTGSTMGVITIAIGALVLLGWGPGPRDGLMTGISRRTGWSLRRTRTGPELTVLALGWALGGTVGVGAVAFALTIGPLSQLFLRLFAPGRDRRRPVQPEGVTAAT